MVAGNFSAAITSAVAAHKQAGNVEEKKFTSLESQVQNIEKEVGIMKGDISDIKTLLKDINSKL